MATTVARAFLLDWLGADRSISCHPDLLEVKTSGKIALHSIASISHMLEQLSLTPHGTKGRAILIEAADRMLPPTANAVLKALEEPPPRTLIMLTTASPHLLLPTIVSRSHVIRLPGTPVAPPVDLSSLFHLLEDPSCATYTKLAAVCSALQKALEKEETRLEKECSVKKADGCEISAAAQHEASSETDGSMTLWSHMVSKHILETVYCAIRARSFVDPSVVTERLLQAMNGIDRGADLSSMLLWFVTSVAL
jgi:hypothetical protein